MEKKQIENTFKSSGSSDDLFDAFREAVALKIKDESLYKILLANKALSNDEIIMYAEKVCKDFPDLCSPIYYWTAQVFESLARHTERLQQAAIYYRKSINANEADVRPYLSLAKMYTPELDVPPFNEAASTLIRGVEKVQSKSKLCFALSDLYKKKKDLSKSNYYQMLGEKYQKNEINNNIR